MQDPIGKIKDKIEDVRSGKLIFSLSLSVKSKMPVSRYFFGTGNDNAAD